VREQRTRFCRSVKKVRDDSDIRQREREREKETCLAFSLSCLDSHFSPSFLFQFVLWLCLLKTCGQSLKNYMHVQVNERERERKIANQESESEKNYSNDEHHT